MAAIVSLSALSPVGAQPAADAVFSPDGLRAAWVSEDRRSILSATRIDASAQWAAPARVLTTRGTVGKLAFSPDGARIAYENSRTWKGDGTPTDRWQLIGIVDLATRQITHVDPSFDIDADPKWTTDGEQVSFTRKVDGLPDAQLTRSFEWLRLGEWEPPPLRPSERFTMASVLAAPFISPPVPSGDGQALAYITREGKARNVYFLRVGEPARRIVNYPSDDGRDLKSLAVSHTGGAIAYVRGDELNSQGDSPNPNSLPDMPQQQVWIMGSSDAAPRWLGTGHDPVFSPDSNRIVWRSGGNVMSASLMWEQGRLVGVDEPVEFLTGERAGLRFSPYGRRVAYERDDGIEVYDIATRTARVIPHGSDVDQGPVWSPDGQRLAFRREPANSPGLGRNSCGLYRYCGPVVAAQPWALWVVDVADLKPRRIWQASPGAGSVYYSLDPSTSPGQHGDELFWSADDRIGFAWERDGWRHLCAVPASGGKATLLTPGKGEVESAALSLDRTQIIYASNIGDLGRRHLSAVGFDGKKATLVKSGESSQWSPTPLADGRLAYIEASWATPPAIKIRGAAGASTVLELPKAPKDFPAAQLVKPELVEFPATDRKKAFGQLFVPAQPKGCAIIFAHGGIRRQMLPGFHYKDAYHYLYAMNQYLASRGCVVLSVEYRSSIMLGEAYRNAPGWGFDANTEMRDIVGGARYLMARKDVDATRGVGVYGLSWGGYITAMALAQRSDLFSVGFDMAGVHIAPDAHGYARSAVGLIEGWKSPVYLAFGDDDMNVDINDGIALGRALQAKRPDVKLKQRVLPGHTHDLAQSFEQMVDIYTEGSDFLLEHLGVR